MLDQMTNLVQNLWPFDHIIDRMFYLTGEVKNPVGNESFVVSALQFSPANFDSNETGDRTLPPSLFFDGILMDKDESTRIVKLKVK